MRTLTTAVTLLSCVLLASPALALTVPYTEGFDTDANAWRDAASSPASHLASGGADGGGYISTTVDVADTIGFGGQTLFRCNDEVSCSGGSFVGDWAAAVGEFSFAIRHDSATPLSFFARIATPNNFPAWAAESPVVANPGEWTTFSFDITDGNPLLTSEFGTFVQTFGNVGDFQIGVSIPDGFTASNVTFDLDRVAVSAVPLPAAGWMLLSGLGAIAWRRKRPR